LRYGFSRSANFFVSFLLDRIDYKIQNSGKRIVAIVPFESGTAGGEMTEDAGARQDAPFAVLEAA
jgi:hypothetical protein